MEFWENKVSQNNKAEGSSKSEKEIAMGKWEAIQQEGIKEGNSAKIKRANEALKKLEKFDQAA